VIKGLQDLDEKGGKAVSEVLVREKHERETWLKTLFTKTVKFFDGDLHHDEKEFKEFDR